MIALEEIYQLFKRRTNTVLFIPQIDGLRFLAIFMVVLYHVNIFVTAKVPFAFRHAPASYWFYGFLNSDKKGVFLFFAISGFILGLPFAKAAKNLGKPVDLKHYFLRRLTRLEPPYFLIMIACYLGIILYPGHGFTAMFSQTFSGLFPSLVASLFYLHNIIFPHNLSVNPVAWSLEIEIQFYLLVPLLVTVFKLPQKWRWASLSLAVFIFIFLQNLFHPAVVTIFSFIQYFLIGFLLVDIYLSGWQTQLSSWLSLPLGLLLLAFIWRIDLVSNPNLGYLFVLAVLGFYVLALTSDVWKKLFSLPVLTSIGGMCYSIYLLHYNIIAVIGNKTIFYNFSRSYPLVYLWHFVILAFFVLLFSAVFYLLIERPCMDKDWPLKFYNIIKSAVKKFKHHKIPNA